MAYSNLLNNIAHPVVSDPGAAFRKGAADALAKTLLKNNEKRTAETHKSNLITAGLNQQGKKFDNSQAPIIAEERTATHNSNLTSAGLNQDVTRISTKKIIADIAHDKSEREIKDSFDSINIASTLPYEQQTLFIDNLIEKYKGNGRASTVLKYLKLAPAEGRNKIFQELNNAGIQGGYLDELYSSRQSGNVTDLTKYVQRADAQKKLEQKAAGKEPTGLTPGEKNNAFLEAKRAQMKEAGDVAGAKKDATMKAEIKNTPDLLDAKGIITPMAQKRTGEKRVTTLASQLVDHYMALNKIGAIINTNKSAAENAYARTLSTKTGQKAAGIVGTQAQSIRQMINNAQPMFVQSIRAATGMGVRGMDTDKELEFYLQATGDPSKDLQSNLAALILADEMYGTGELAAKMNSTLSKDQYKALNKKIAEVHKEGKLYAKRKNKEQAELRRNLPKEALKLYYNGKPDDWTQDQFDQDFLDRFHVLPEEK